MPWLTPTCLSSWGPRHRPARNAGTLAVLVPLLTGCTDSHTAIATVAVGLGGLAAALAYALGRQRAAARAADTRHTPAAPPVPAAQVPAHIDPEPLLDALPGPAVLLDKGGAGWRVRRANAAALALWPALVPGFGGSPVAASWPPGLRERLQARVTPSGGAGSPWQSVVMAGSWALAWQDAPAPTATETQADNDSFSFTLSHDLRAPLRVVEGFTRIVKEDYGPQLDRVGNDHLDRVLGAAARMNLMIDALLALARLSQQPLQRQPVNLSQLAGYVVDDLRRGSPDRTVECDIEAGLTVTGDPTLLRLVLENLIGNAWKYTAKAASPRIELRREACAHAAGLGFVVRDNGAGFDMRSADRLFGLFQRLHSASDFPGHGVGLASVRRIVERHGGRVWAESEPGRGAAFHVELT